MKHLPYIIDQNGIHEDLQVAFVIENDVRTKNGPSKVAFLRKLRTTGRYMVHVEVYHRVHFGHTTPCQYAPHKARYGDDVQIMRHR